MKNSLKTRVLEALDGRSWVNTAMLSHLAGLCPVRSVSSYMERLRRWGLVRRKKTPRGLSLYSISERGRQRLAWLRTRGKP